MAWRWQTRQRPPSRVSGEGAVGGKKMAPLRVERGRGLGETPFRLAFRGSEGYGRGWKEATPSVPRFE